MFAFKQRFSNYSKIWHLVFPSNQPRVPTAVQAKYFSVAFGLKVLRPENSKPCYFVYITDVDIDKI